MTGERGPISKRNAQEEALAGNPSRRALPAPNDTAEPQKLPEPLDFVPSPPEWLAGTTGAIGSMAVDAWNTLAPLLVDARQLRDGDQISLARYCRYVAEWVELSNEIDINGLTIVNTTKFGETTIENPAFRARARNETAIAALEKELGLSPRARVEVQSRLMRHQASLPTLPGKNAAPQSGAVGFLNNDGDDDED